MLWGIPLLLGISLLLVVALAASASVVIVCGALALGRRGAREGRGLVKGLLSCVGWGRASLEKD